MLGALAIARASALNASKLLAAATAFDLASNLNKSKLHFFDDGNIIASRKN